MRSMVEGVAASSSVFVSKEFATVPGVGAVAAPSTAFGGPPPPLRGGGCAQRSHLHRRRRDRRGGFTLVEVLVAFTVMATVLGVLYRGVVQTRAGAAGFDARTQAEIVAEAVLAEFGARRDLRDGSYAGAHDGRRWTLKAQTVDLSAQMPKPADVKPGEGKPDASQTGLGQPGPAQAGTGPAGPSKADPNKPKWITQRLVLRVATSGRPLETEVIRLAKAPPPEDRR